MCITWPLQLLVSLVLVLISQENLNEPDSSSSSSSSSCGSWTCFVSCPCECQSQRSSFITSERSISDRLTELLCLQSVELFLQSVLSVTACLFCRIKTRWNNSALSLFDLIKDRPEVFMIHSLFSIILTAFQLCSRVSEVAKACLVPVRPPEDGRYQTYLLLSTWRVHVLIKIFESNGLYDNHFNHNKMSH